MAVILQLLQFILTNPTVVSELVQLLTSLVSHLKATPQSVLQQVLAVLADPKAQADIKATLASINQLLVDIKADLAK